MDDRKGVIEIRRINPDDDERYLVRKPIFVCYEKVMADFEGMKTLVENIQNYDAAHFTLDLYLDEEFEPGRMHIVFADSLWITEDGFREIFKEEPLTVKEAMDFNREWQRQEFARLDQLERQDGASAHG